MSTLTQLKEYTASTRRPCAEPRFGSRSVPADHPRVAQPKLSRYPRRAGRRRTPV